MPVLLFFWRNPWAAMALAAAALWAFIQWQDYRIDTLKAENKRVTGQAKADAIVHKKVVNAFEDKEKVDHGREKFRREAAEEIGKGRATDAPPTPVLRNAYDRVYRQLYPGSKANP